MNSGMQTFFFLASYGFMSKVLVLFIPVVKKIRDPENFFPDPGVIKAPVPDPQHCSGASFKYEQKSW
jgi:hypothetical protein